MMTTKQKIIATTIRSLALKGYEASSIRDIAIKVGIQPSVLYYYFPNKKALLNDARNDILARLHDATEHLAEDANPKQYLSAHLDYQFKHRVEIVALLQYYMAVSDDFPVSEYGYIPTQAYTHMVTYLKMHDNKTLVDRQLMFRAKGLQHLVDGFLIEYAARSLSSVELTELVDDLTSFISDGLSPMQLPKKRISHV